MTREERLTVGIGVSVCIVVGLVGCSRSADLSGEVFWVTSVQRTVQAAGVEVVLLPRDDRVVGEFKTLGRDFSGEYRELYANYERAKEVAERAGVWPSMPRGAGPREMAEFERRMKAWTEANAPREAAWGRVQRLLDTYENRVLEVIRKHEWRSVLTDSVGRYEITGVPSGRYLVFARYPKGEFRYWLVPVELRPGRQAVNLSNANADPNLATFLLALKE